MKVLKWKIVCILSFPYLPSSITKPRISNRVERVQGNKTTKTTVTGVLDYLLGLCLLSGFCIPFFFFLHHLYWFEIIPYYLEFILQQMTVWLTRKYKHTQRTLRAITLSHVSIVSIQLERNYMWEISGTCVGAE